VAMPSMWVINLDKSVDRWKMCQEEFAKHGVHGERFPAVLGKALSKVELEEKATLWARWFCTPGMIGCFLSHMGCWKKVVDEGHEAAIVLEDDIVLFDGFEGKVKDLLLELPDDWDVCLLGAVGCVDPVKEPVHMQLYGLIVGGWHTSPGKSRSVSENVFVPYKPAGTHAYMLSKRGAAKMLKRNPKARYHVDVTAWSQQDLNLYACKDFLATQRFGDDTTVSKTGKPLTEGFLRWIWTVSGIGSMGSRAGIENLTWAWKVALFSIPLPFGRHIIVETGPASIPFLVAVVVAAACRNLKLLGGALAYFTFLITTIRALAGNFNPVPLGSLTLVSGALLLLG